MHRVLLYWKLFTFTSKIFSKMTSMILTVENFGKILISLPSNYKSSSETLTSKSFGFIGTYTLANDKDISLTARRI